MATPGMEIEDVVEAGGILELCRRQLEEALPIAVRTMIELAQSSEKDNVRLNAASEILERGGMPKKTEVTHKIDPNEHKEADRQALELVEAMAANKEIDVSPKELSFETSVVLDGDEPDELPIAAPDTYPEGSVIESTLTDPDEEIVIPIQL